MRLKALIFDVDGTLADTEEAHRRAFNAAFDELGLPWNWSKPKYAHLLMTTGGKERIAAYIDSLPMPAPERRACALRVDEIHQAKTRHYTEQVSKGEVPLREGVARLLDDAVRSRVSLCIASTTTLVNVDTLLRAHFGPDASARFAVVGAGDQVRSKKPAPDIYEYVLRRIDASASDCVAIEDSYNGLCAAKAAGLFTIVTPSFWTRTEDFSAADWVLPSLGSSERPLPPQAASLVGNSVLGIREINRRLNDVSPQRALERTR